MATTITTIQKQTLYSIREDHYQLIQMIEEADGEVTEDILQQLQLNAVDFENKAVSIGFVIKSFEDKEGLIDREIKRLQELKSKACKNQENLKERLAAAMEQLRFEKIETPFLKLSFRKSDAVNITDERMIPAEFLTSKTVVDISKLKIKEAFKQGRAIPGAELCIKKNLQIK